MPRLLIAATLVATAGALPSFAIANPHLDLAFEDSVAPFLKTYCYDCHGLEKTKADVDFTLYRGLADVRGDDFLWEAALEMLETHEMPPEDEKQPSLKEREKIASWIRESLYTFDPDNPDPGRVTIRRLNRAEYNNTIRDLVGVPLRPADDFPQDDAGYGFDTIGDVLSLPPILLERYLAAAEAVIDRAIVTEPPPARVRRFPINLLEVGFNALGDRGDGWAHLVSLEEDDVAVELPIASPGDYKVRVLAYADATGGILDYDKSNAEAFEGAISEKPPMISLQVGDAFIEEFEVTTDAENPQVYEARVGVPSGNQRFRAVVHRDRGGDGELYMKNGRLGKQQAGVVYVKWLEIEGPLPGVTRRIPAEDLTPRGRTLPLDNGHVLLPGEARLEHVVSLEKESEVLIRAYAYADQAGDETAQLELKIDGQLAERFEVDAPAKMKPLPGQRLFSAALLDPRPKVYKTIVRLPAGRHTLSAAFANDFEDPSHPNPNFRDRNLYIEALETTDLGTHWAPPPMPPQIARHFEQAQSISEPRQRARSVIESFGAFAWRRPVYSNEIDRLMELYDLAEQSGDSFEGRVKLAMKAVLASPNFIYRRESQPNPNDPNETHPIDEYALASRLSYFLWSSLPDDELREHAQNGSLRHNLRSQVSRMLESPKATALVENFAGQWLQTRRMESVRPDRELFEAFSKLLRDDMQTETESLFEYVMRENCSVLELLNADYTFVNERLAQHYGIPGVAGDQFRKVSLASLPRRGVLSHGSILTLTSNPNRTSPVKRGQWVLENLLGTPPPPAPPDVPELEKEPGVATGSLREQMEQHRNNPSCISCHERMDPIGFALENFDAIGSWRGTDGGEPIDASATLDSGESFSGAVELVEILSTTRRGDYLTALTRKMLTYALGRGLEYYDRPAIERIVESVEQSEFRFESLVAGIAESVPFQLRRGDGQRSSHPESYSLATDN